MATYTNDDVNAALEQGLISKEDAQYLSDALESSPAYGAMTGGTLGAIGGGIAGNIGHNALLERAAQAAEAPQINLPNVGKGKLGKALDIGASALLSGGLGAGLGSLVAPGSAGEGVQGTDKDEALRALIDPNTPPEVKKQILAALQASEEQGTGTPWGAIGGGTVGTIAGGLAGLQGMKKLGNFAPRSLGGALGGAAGAGTGAGIGATLGNLAAPAGPTSPYLNPLSEEQDFADGGRVPFNGLLGIDKVPAMLDGNPYQPEYVLPGDTTAALGVANLDNIRTMTHDPFETARRRSIERMQNPLSLADGGIVRPSGWTALQNRQQQLADQERQALGLPSSNKVPEQASPPKEPIDDLDLASLPPSPYKDTRSWSQKYLGL